MSFIFFWLPSYHPIHKKIKFQITLNMPRSIDHLFIEGLDKRDELDLFDVLNREISKKQGIESTYHEFKSSLNPYYSKDMFKWIALDGRNTLIPNGILRNEQVVNKRTVNVGIEFKKYHDTSYALYQVGSDDSVFRNALKRNKLDDKYKDGSPKFPIAYILHLKVQPLIGTTLYLREFNRSMDSKRVRWNNYDLNKTLSKKVADFRNKLKLKEEVNKVTLFGWQHYINGSLPTDGKLKEPNLDEHDGIWCFVRYEGEKVGAKNVPVQFNNPKEWKITPLETLFKTRVIISPRSYHLHMDRETANKITIRHLFNKYKPSFTYPINKGSFSNYSWIHYDSRFSLHNVLEMMHRFEQEIINKMKTDLVDTYVDLFRKYLTNISKSNFEISTDLDIQVQRAVKVVQDNWQRFKRKLKKKYYGKGQLHHHMMKFDDILKSVEKGDKANRRNPILDIYKQFKDWQKKESLNPDFINILLNKYFSLNDHSDISMMDSKKITVRNGTYILRWRNTQTINEWMSKSSSERPNAQVIVVPRSIKMPSTQEFINQDVDLLMPVLVIYVTVVDKVKSITIKPKMGQFTKNNIPMKYHDVLGLEKNFQLLDHLMPEFLYIKFSKGVTSGLDHVSFMDEELKIATTSINTAKSFTMSIECKDSFSKNELLKGNFSVDGSCTFKLWNGTNEMASVNFKDNDLHKIIRLHVYQRIPSARTFQGDKFYGYHIHPIQEIQLNMSHQILTKDHIQATKYGDIWTTHIIDLYLKNMVIEGYHFANLYGNKRGYVLGSQRDRVSNKSYLENRLLNVPLRANGDPNSGQYVFYEASNSDKKEQFVTMTLDIDIVDIRSGKPYDVSSKRRFGESKWEFTLYPSDNKAPMLSMNGTNVDYINYHMDKKHNETIKPQQWLGTFNQVQLIPDYYDMLYHYKDRSDNRNRSFSSAFRPQYTGIIPRNTNLHEYKWYQKLQVYNKWDYDKFMNSFQIGSCIANWSDKCKELHEQIMQDKKSVGKLLNRLASQVWLYSEDEYYDIIDKLKALLELQIQFNQLQPFNMDYYKALTSPKLSRKKLKESTQVFNFTEQEKMAIVYQIMPINPMHIVVKNDDGEEEMIEVLLRVTEAIEDDSMMAFSTLRMKKLTEDILRGNEVKFGTDYETVPLDPDNIKKIKKMLFNAKLSDLVKTINIVDPNNIKGSADKLIELGYDKQSISFILTYNQYEDKLIQDYKKAIRVQKTKMNRIERKIIRWEKKLKKATQFVNIVPFTEKIENLQEQLGPIKNKINNLEQDIVNWGLVDKFNK